MQGLIITNKGMEHIAALELKELLKINKTEIRDSTVKFQIRKEKDLELLKKKSRAASRILYLFGETSITKNLEKNIPKISKIIKSVQLDKFLKNKIYRVDCERLGEHNFKSVDISRELVKILIKQGYDRVTFKNPEVIIYIFITNKKSYMGIDFSGDISKREYKIFNNPRSIKGNIAYALVRESNYEKGKTLVDPFCLSGEIVIEAASFAKGKIFAYDQLERNIIAAKKNSKIAGVSETIEFGNYGLSWLETKHKNSIDCVVTKLPESSKRKEKGRVGVIYREFFEQSHEILKNKGILVVISKDKDIIKKEKGKLKISKEHTIYSGGTSLEITVLKKNAL